MGIIISIIIIWLFSSWLKTRNLKSVQTQPFDFERMSGKPTNFIDEQ